MGRSGDYGIPFWFKPLLWFVGIAAIWAVALVPEMIMYSLYSSIAPETVLEKILTLGVFWVCGGSVSVFFFVAAVIVSGAWTVCVIDG